MLVHLNAKLNKSLKMVSKFEWERNQLVTFFWDRVCNLSDNLLVRSNTKKQALLKSVCFVCELRFYQ